MKKSVLVLLALLALAPCAQLMAQPSAAPVPDVEQFLTTLSSGQTPTPGDTVPSPSFAANCTSNSDCPTGQLCCNLCGKPPDEGSSCRYCTTPVRGRCPLVV